MRKEVNINERKKMILAMEFIARHVNDEDVFDRWLMSGVPDGDIKYGSIDVDDVDDYYTEDETFKDFMSCFLRVMKGAYNSGGLYCNGIVCKDKDDYKQ